MLSHDECFVLPILRVYFHSLRETTCSKYSEFRCSIDRELRNILICHTLHYDSPTKDEVINRGPSYAFIQFNPIQFINSYTGRKNLVVSQEQKIQTYILHPIIKK
jgi:hypothetical protein